LGRRPGHPLTDGYLSVRFKPSSSLFPVVQKLYRDLLQIEARVESSGGGKPAAIAASREALETALRNLGFSSYRDFMHTAFESEIRSREALVLQKRAAAPASTAEASVTSSAHLPALRLVQSCQDALARLDRLFHLLDITSLNDRIRSKSASVTSLSGSTQMLSLNGSIETEQLGATASGLGTVMDWLQESSKDISQGCDQLAAQLSAVTDEIKSVVFEISSAKLQIEMTTCFATELLHLDLAASSAMPPGAIQNLYSSSRRAVDRALTGLAAIHKDLRSLDNAQDSMRKNIRALHLIYLKGRMEMAAVASERLGIIFDNLKQQLDETDENVETLESMIDQLENELLSGVALSSPIVQAVAAIDPGPA